MPSNQLQTYRLERLSCSNCAKTFENNVKRINGVTYAEVNFAAAKITVGGTASIQDIEKAGAFANIKVIPNEKHGVEKKNPFWIRHGRLVLASLLTVLGITASFVLETDHYITTLLLALAILVGGITLFKAGLNNLIHLRFDMKTLMTVAVIGAALIGEWKEAAVVVILFAISEALEDFSMDKARRSIRSLIAIAPDEALIRRNGKEITVPVKDIDIGDIMLVKPGDKIAMDGMIKAGQSAINQAPITGESIPVDKTPGQNVFAGTINQDGYLEVEVTKKAENTTIAKIIHLVEEAQAERAPSQVFIDRFAAWYTPVIIGIAFLVAIGPPLFGAAWPTWIYQGLAILVVGCPCALVISTPVAIVTAIGKAARSGILIKGGAHLEQIGAINAVAFDKTGTLTEGRPIVTDMTFFTDYREKALGYLYALEKQSNHPLAKAIVQDIEQHRPIDTNDIHITDFTTIQGKGITGRVNGKMIYAGSPQLFAEIQSDQKGVDDFIRTHQNDGKTIVLCGTDKSIFLAAALRDEPRQESKNAIKQLHQLEIKHTFMLTGDHPKTAHALGKELGLTDIQARLLPEDKLHFIKQYEKMHQTIAMVGDGINDTPALAAATVGIAMGTAGTDSALETADIAFMDDDLRKLPLTVRLSQKTLAIIKQNIAFAIGIKVFALLLVIPGWLTLWIAIFSDMGATLLVTLNALRLMKKH